MRVVLSETMLESMILMQRGHRFQIPRTLRTKELMVSLLRSTEREVDFRTEYLHDILCQKYNTFTILHVRYE